MEFYLVRHGKTDLNVRRRLQGQSNTALNEEGIAQAKMLRRKIEERGISFDRVFSSPLDRAVVTAQIAAGDGLKVETDPRLLEIDFGPFEGKGYEVLDNMIDEFLTDGGAPEGVEKLTDLSARVGSFFTDISESCGPDDRALVVTHGLTLRATLGWMFGLSWDEAWKLYIINCKPIRVTCLDGQYTLREPDSLDALRVGSWFGDVQGEEPLENLFSFSWIKEGDIPEAVEVEQICFPPHEACSPQDMRDRIKAAPEMFLIARDRKTGLLAGFLNGVATGEERFRDEFFTDASLHDKSGQTAMILGLDVRPEFRRMGLGTELMRRFAKTEKERGRKKLVLTCLEDKVLMYEKMGYSDLGLANSAWGGEEWHEMAMELTGEN